MNNESDTHEKKEEWVEAILNHIQTILEKEFSQEIKEELTYIIKNYDKLQKNSKNLPPNLKQIIEELEQFQATYNVYKDRGYEESIPPLVSKIVKKIRKSLELIKNEAILTAILNKEDLTLQNFKENLKANLYKITMLTFKEKSQLNNLIQKDMLSKEDKERIISLLSKLKNEELIALFGKLYAFMKKGKKFPKELIFNKFLNLHFPLLLKKGLFLNWEYVCDVCSKAYLNQDFIPPEQYIKGMENLIFLPLSSFKQIYEKWLLHKHGKNSDTLIEELGVEQFSKKSHKVSESYLAKPLPVDFDKLVDPFINTLSRYITEKDREEHSNMRYGGTHPDIALIDLYSHRTRSKWTGIIYKITQIKDLDLNPIDDGLIQIGFSTERFSSRWFWYQVDAFTHNKELEIYQLMRDFENAGEDLKEVTGLSGNGVGYIGKYKTFTWEILEICWSDGKLRTREIDWIAKFNLEFPDRVGNIDKGGGGGTKIVIPPILLIPLIARGYWSPEIAKILEKEYGIICSKDVVTKRINEYWGSIYNARILFMKPILKMLMSQGYSATYLSTVFYHTTSQGVANLSSVFWNEDFKKKRLELIKDHLISLFKKGYEVYEMDSELRGVPWETVRKEYIPLWWGTTKDARIEIVKPILAEMLSEGYTLKDIAIFLEQDSIDRLRKQISLFWAFKGGRGLWGTILIFVEYIAFKKLTPNEVYKLKYDDIKNDLENLDYLKFLTEYKKIPIMNHSMFRSLFPDKSQSTYYSWKKKAETDV